MKIKIKMEKDSKKPPNDIFFIFWFLLNLFTSMFVFINTVHINTLQDFYLSNCVKPSFQTFMSHFWAKYSIKMSFQLQGIFHKVKVLKAVILNTCFRLHSQASTVNFSRKQPKILMNRLTTF